ncbi:protein binding protein [Dorcoceras hygrometricum]|uniref:Ribosomal RNA-processing protein 40 n=1 Tax=Dorcoceras hygrometricum TaxID=472368 RepID=A0A2Z7D9K3_9LAMI|nr:protein binding protein [Dorcoceras hygrometricum]
MAIRGVDFKWYDGFFMSMLATSMYPFANSSGAYFKVDYTAVFVFRLLMFVDNGLASGMGLDLGWQQRYVRFCGRTVVLSILALLLYPFLWVWTIIGTLWFTCSRDCLPEEGQKWGFLIWLLFSYCGLLCIAGICMGMWLTRRRALLLRAQQGISVSEYGVLVDMVRVPDWALEAAGQEMRGMGQDAAAYQPGPYLNPSQREAVEALIQELPKFMLKAVPTDCSECPICLEEFHFGVEVRGLPCAHNFHVECIDEWLRLNVKCPRCRCSVFPNLDLTALSGMRAESERSSSDVVITSRYSRNQPHSQQYLLRLQGLLRAVSSENFSSSSETVNAETEAGREPPATATRSVEFTEPVQIMDSKPSSSPASFVDQQVFPGDVVLDLSNLTNQTIKLGGGLRQDGDVISVMKAGILRFTKPNKYWIESSNKRYIPSVGDDILGIVVDTKADNFLVDIKGPTVAYLPVLAFEGGTRRNIPKFDMPVVLFNATMRLVEYISAILTLGNFYCLQMGTLLYVRVVKANTGMNPELSCMDASGKAAEYGPLKDGFMFESSTGLSRMLLKSPTCPVLEVLGKKLAFEIAVGLNGRVWVNATSPSIVILVANTILQTESLSPTQQKIRVESLLQRLH